MAGMNGCTSVNKTAENTVITESSTQAGEEAAVALPS